MIVMMIILMISIGIMIVILMIVMNIVIMMIVMINYIGDAKIDDWDDDSYVEKMDRNDKS